MKEGNTIDFTEEDAVRTLTCALLKVDFGISISLPKGKLCPTIPNRLDYIHILEDLLAEIGIDSKGRPIRGIDIGCGASCIYPILGCTINSNWSFTATEIDPDSISYARQNITQNNLAERITVNQVKEGDKELFPVNGPLDFCMCNPPFYSSEEDIRQRRLGKRSSPSSEAVYSKSESISKGGEVHFISLIIQQSLLNRDQVALYTSLVGIKSNLLMLQKKLKQENIPFVKVIKSTVGRTTRWVLAWSFHQETVLLIPSKLKINADTDSQIKIVEMMEKELKLPITNDNSWIEVTKDSWSRKARRSEEGSLEIPKFKFALDQDEKSISFILGSSQGRDHLTSMVNHLRTTIHK